MNLQINRGNFAIDRQIFLYSSSVSINNSEYTLILPTWETSRIA